MVYQILVLDKHSENFVKTNHLDHLELVNFVFLGASDLERYLGSGGFDAVLYSNQEGKKFAESYITKYPLTLNICLKKLKEFLLHRPGLELAIGKSLKGESLEDALMLFFKEASSTIDAATGPLAFKFIEKLNDEVGTTGFKEYMESVLFAMQSYFQSDHVYWLGDGEFEYFVRQMWKVHRLGESFLGIKSRPSFFSSGSTEQEDLADLLQRLQGALPKDWSHRQSSFRLDLGPTPDSYTVVLPVFRGNKVLGQLFLVSPKKWSFPRSGANSLEGISKAIGAGVEFSRAFSEMEHKSYHDDVTDLYNQKYLKIAVNREIEKSKRHGTSFSILFIDIDHFKKVNDTMGHIVGSKILEEVGCELGNIIRQTDYGFRYGGDEFLLLLTDMNSEAAAVVAERIRRHVESLTFKIDGNEIKVTLSIGVASYPEHAQTWRDIIRLADQAMYHGKNKSRNIIVVAS